MFFQRTFPAVFFGALAWALAFVLAMAAGNAHAHSSSNSYLTLSVRDDALVLRTDINLRDIDLLFDLDTNRDGQVSWGETAERMAELQAWVQKGVTLRSEGQACALQPLDMLASQHADGYYLSGEWSVACSGGVPVAQTLQKPLALRYDLMFAQDNLHRGLLRVDLPQARSSAILSPDQPEASLLQGDMSPLSVLKRYIVEGVWHIWIGIDHILFLLSLLVLAPLVVSRKKVVQWEPVPCFRTAVMNVLTVVTAFTVAHSITLVLSVLQWVNPPVNLIEP
ncbi:MAG: HupE/UreJ family protein, partial [Burkholderiaceae bacterium]|nr:HupE/UreJ family protein [Burkholderiaceae bacterium]